MSDLAERIAVTHQRLETYQDIADIGGYNGAVVQEMGRLATVAPDDAYGIAEAFEPDLRASVLTIIGKKSRDIGPVFEARSIVDGIELSADRRNRRLWGITVAAIGLDNEFALDTAREISTPDLKTSALLRLFDASEAEEPRRELLHEALDVLDESSTQSMPQYVFEVARRASATDLGLAEQAYRRVEGWLSARSGHSIQHAIRSAIDSRDAGLILRDKEVVLRVLSARLEEDVERPSHTELSPLEDSVRLLRLFAKDPVEHSQLVGIITRAAQATAAYPKQ